MKNSDIKQMIKSLKEMRNILFNGKKTILKDDFYIELQNTKRLRKKGAISGCALASMI
jgi:hypothetical protein